MMDYMKRLLIVFIIALTVSLLFIGGGRANTKIEEKKSPHEKAVSHSLTGSVFLLFYGKNKIPSQTIGNNV